MASGCYCLSHRWDGADELLPEENLFYTNTELIEKILEYSDCPESSKQQKRNRMEGIVRQRFDIDQVKDRFMGVLEGIAINDSPSK